MAETFPGSKNSRTKQFNSMFSGLPKQIQQAATNAYKQFRRDPNHPSLSLHPLKDTKKGNHKNATFAVSVTRRYRALFVVEGNTNIWYWIGSHEDYNNFTGAK